MLVQIGWVVGNHWKKAIGAHHWMRDTVIAVTNEGAVMGEWFGNALALITIVMVNGYRFSHLSSRHSEIRRPCLVNQGNENNEVFPQIMATLISCCE